MRGEDESPPVIQQILNNETSSHQFVKAVTFVNNKRLSNYEAVPETNYYVLHDEYFNLLKNKDVQKSDNQEIHQTVTNERMTNLVNDERMPKPVNSFPEIYIELSSTDQNIRITDSEYDHPPPTNRLNEEISVYPIIIKEESTYQPLKTRIPNFEQSLDYLKTTNQSYCSKSTFSTISTPENMEIPDTISSYIQLHPELNYIQCTPNMVSEHQEKSKDNKFKKSLKNHNEESYNSSKIIFNPTFTCPEYDINNYIRKDTKQESESKKEKEFLDKSIKTSANTEVTETGQ